MLSEHMFFILAVLAERSRHGYDMIRRVAELSKGDVKLATGTLYPALERLLTLGLIQRTDLVDEEASNRRYYVLTTAGAERLQAEVALRRRQARAGALSLRTRRSMAH